MFFLPLKPALLRLNGVHFLFQQPSAAGIRARNRSLRLFHLPEDLVPALRSAVEIGLFLSGRLLLVRKRSGAPGDIVGVSGANHAAPRNRFFADLLDVQNQIGSSFQQRLVVRDIENRAVKSNDETLQPFEHLNIEVVGRFIQQQEIGAAQQKPGNLQLDFFTAGKRPNRTFRCENVRMQPDFSGCFRTVRRMEPGKQR